MNGILTDLFGESSIIIDLQSQIAEVYIGGQRAGWSVVATGKEGFDTPAGEYTILEKVVDKYSTLYGKTVDADGNTVRADADIRRHSRRRAGGLLLRRCLTGCALRGAASGCMPDGFRVQAIRLRTGCIRLPRSLQSSSSSYVRIGTPVRIIR